MKILLLSAPYLKEYMRNARCDFVSLSATQWYPLLLGYCGAYLESLGHQVKLIDAPAHYLDHAATKKMILEFKPDLLVVYTGRQSEDNDLQFTDDLLAETGITGVIVGPFASIDPSATLLKSERVELLVAGEFEAAVGEIAAGKEKAQIANLVYKQDNQIVRNPMRPYLNREQLDSIPFISRFFSKQIDLYRYKTPSELYPYMDMLTGRGCIWGMCTYCLWVHTYVQGMTYNTRSIDNVIEEFQFIASDLPQVRSVMIQDDTFTEERALEFCEAKLKAGNKLPWSCYARANMNLEALQLMKRAGCRNLHVGYESADPKVLQRIKKGLSPDRMERFTSDAKKAGLRIHGDFALGFPGETPDSALATISWARKLNPATAQFQLMIPFPGTPFYQEMEKNGWLNDAGQPDMPQFSNEQIRAMAKRAYREYYLSTQYLWKSIRNPQEYLFNQFKTITRAIPAMFWKKWGV